CREWVHFPSAGEPWVITHVSGGTVHVFFGNIGAGAPPSRDGGGKILVFAVPRRSPVLPEIPTTAEAGLPGHPGGSAALGRGHQKEQYRRGLRHCEAHSRIRAAVKNLRQCDGRTNGAGQRHFGVMMAS